MSPAPGLYTCIKSWKKCIKSDLKEISLKLAKMGKVIRLFCRYKNFVPRDCLSLPRGYIHVFNHEKMYKIRLQRHFLKLATNEWSDKTFLLTSKLCPMGFVCPCPGAIYMYKIMKKCIKSDFKEMFWNFQQMTEVTRCSCWHQSFVPKGLSVSASGLYTCMKSWKSDFKKIFWNLWQMTEITRGFCWHQIVVPWGCLPLTYGYLHLLNHEKICIKSEVKEILYKLATNDHSDEAFLLTLQFWP